MTVLEARREFPHTCTDMVYLNHAAVAPLSFRVRDAVDRYQTRRALKGIEPYPWAMRIAQETREMLGTMLNARADQIGFVMNTSDGINILAQGIDWKAGDRVLINNLEFPANVYPFLNLQRRGVVVDVVDAVDFKITPQQITAALTEGTRIVSISHVQFSTGAKADLQAIGKLCRERGILFCVDAIQSLPHTSIDVERDAIDWLACGSHKWMMAGEGAAFIYASDRALAEIHQPFLGWTSVDDPFNFEPHPERPRTGAARYENGTINYSAIAALRASLRFFFEFGLLEMERSVLDLTAYTIDRLEMKGIEVITPKNEEERSGIVCFTLDDAQNVFERLTKENIIISMRSGRLRIASHFYNTEEEIRKLFIAL